MSGNTLMYCWCKCPQFLERVDLLRVVSSVDLLSGTWNRPSADSLPVPLLPSSLTATGWLRKQWAWGWFQISNNKYNNPFVGADCVTQWLSLGLSVPVNLTILSPHSHKKQLMQVKRGNKNGGWGWKIFIVFFMLPEIGSRATCLSGKHSTTELYP